MKSKLIKNLLRCLFVLMVIAMPLILSAGPGDPGWVDPGCDPLDPKCPIDGGLSALLVLGAGYGIKKVRDARKTTSNT